MLSLLSTCSLPALVKWYRGAASSAYNASSRGNDTSMPSRYIFILNQSSARKFKYVSFAMARSDTFKPRAGKPSSRKRSSTPAPKPLLSTMISAGRLLGGMASYSAFTAPVSCIRSKLRHTVSGCITGP